MDEPKSKPTPFTDRWKAWDRRDTAATLGVVMIVTGVILALVGRPEPALIWTGAVIAAIALLADWIQSFEAGASGAKVTLQDVAKVIENAKVSAPTIGLPGYVSDESDEPDRLLPHLVPGEYVSWPAVQAALTAVGSNSRSDRSNAWGNLNQLASQGTAVLNLEPEADESGATGAATKPR